MVSVIVPVYNTGKYLSKCVDSLLEQTYRDFEVIIVDDGSKDESGIICDEQSARSEKIRVFHKPNGGVSTARNLGIEKAKGDYIAFCDPDDWVSPDCLQVMSQKNAEEEVDLVACGFCEFTKNGLEYNNSKASSSEKLFNREEALFSLLKQDTFAAAVWSKLFKMEIIQANRLRFDDELLMGQDIHFCFCYIQHCRSVVYNALPMYFYNRESLGVTSSRVPLTKRKMSVLKAYVKIADMSHETYPELEKMAYSIFSSICLDFIFLYYRSHMNSPEILETLKKNFVQYNAYFYASKEYNKRRKIIARLIPAHPRLYYTVVNMKRVADNTFTDFKKRIGKR